MSVWTHVAGVIRIDAIPMLFRVPTLNEIKKMFLQGVPEGSEGPLHVDVARTESDSASVLYCNIVVYGDLRDFDAEDVVKIIMWVETKARELEEQKMLIRQGVIDIQTEGKTEVILHRKGEMWAVETIFNEGENK